MRKTERPEHVAEVELVRLDDLDVMIFDDAGVARESFGRGKSMFFYEPDTVSLLGPAYGQQRMMKTWASSRMPQ